MYMEVAVHVAASSRIAGTKGILGTSLHWHVHLHRSCKFKAATIICTKCRYRHAQM